MQTPYKNDLVFFGLEYFVYHKKQGQLLVKHVQSCCVLTTQIVDFGFDN